MSIAAYQGVCPTCRYDHSEHVTALASGSGDHAELARLAEAATKGPWASERSVDKWGVSVIASNEKGHIGNPTRGQVCHVSVVAGASGDDPDLAQANAAFIAAANPATVLALIAEVAALRDQLDWMTRDRNAVIGERDRADTMMQSVDDRATEAERKLAEADKCARSIVAMEIPPGDDPEQRMKLLSMLARAQVLARTFLSKEAETSFPVNLRYPAH